MPGCTTAAAPAKQLGKVRSSLVKIGGKPFAVIVTTDGKYSFVTIHNAVAVLSNGSALAPTLIHTISVPGADKGGAITPDGKYLLLASGSGAKVISVANAEQGIATVLGTLASPNGRGAVQVALSPNGKFAFVTLQSSGGMAVFNFEQALASNFTSSGFVGIVPTGVEPVGIAEYGKWLYMTSIEKVKTAVPSKGLLSVVSMHRAEIKPARAVVANVTAGCSPVRVIISGNGSVAWVTARESDTLLGFSVPDLRSNPSHALIARVGVGVSPIGVSFAAAGKRIIVANSDLKSIAGAVPSLSVISTSQALAGKPALLGLIKSGVLPRQFATEGKALLVTNNGSGQLQAINLSDLP
jgi:DNA-binding beta-propeller fold protein YncE